VHDHMDQTYQRTINVSCVCSIMSYLRNRFLFS
jgi:hypothetical protein